MKKSLFLGLALLAASAQVKADIYTLVSALGRYPSITNSFTTWQTSDGSTITGADAEDYWVDKNNIMKFDDVNLSDISLVSPYKSSDDASNSGSLSIGGIMANVNNSRLISGENLNYSIRLMASDDADVDTSTGGVLGANNLIMNKSALSLGMESRMFKTVQMDADVNAVGGSLNIYADTISTNGGEAKTFSVNGGSIFLNLLSGTSNSVSWDIDGSSKIELRNTGGINSGNMSISRAASNTSGTITFMQKDTTSIANINSQHQQWHY